MEKKLKKYFRYCHASIEKGYHNSQALLVYSYQLCIGILIDNTMYILESRERTNTTIKHISKLNGFCNIENLNYVIIENFLFQCLLRTITPFGNKQWKPTHSFSDIHSKQRFQYKIAERMLNQVNDTIGIITRLETSLNLNDADVTTYKRDLNTLSQLLERYIDTDMNLKEIKDSLILLEKLS